MNIKHRIYKRQIIKELCFGKNLSALEISQRIRKSLPLTTKILNELISEEFVQESGYALSTGGRRPLMYSLIADKMYAISVAMDQLITRIGIIDVQSYKIIHSEKFDLTLPHNSLAKDQLIDIIKSFISKSNISQEKIIGIGIGMPGFVDTEKGVNHSFMPMGKKEESLRTYLEQALDFPVCLDNDSSLIALTELKLGAARDKKNSMVINFGWGVGLGLIINGELFRGNNGFAGEFSHIPLFDNNKLCSCGKSGCLETEASMLVILEKAKEALEAGRVSAIKEIPADSEEASFNIIHAALAGDQLAVELLSDTAYNIGRGIAILIHILNPQQVIISGRGAMAGNMLLPAIYQAVNKYCIPSLAAYTEIVVSDFSTNAELIGAAALIIENFDKKEVNQLKTSVAEMEK
ncbi:MAG: ROK family protein [Ginsengibacter sp.]|jgi:glucokinase-like ROK family protein